MQAELQALTSNNTWSIVDLPPGKIHLDVDGCTRLSIRLMAVLKVRVLLAIDATRGWHLEQLKVNNVFLHGDLNEESQADHSLYTKSTAKSFTALLVYVDDIVLAGNSLKEIAHVKHLLDQKFRIKDLGALRFFLGFEISRYDAGIFFNQRKYTLELLEDTSYFAAKPSHVPYDPTLKLTTTDGDLLSKPATYRRLVGRLVYLTNSRPDISYAVQNLSQYVSQPRAPHLKDANRILRYLQACPAKGILFSSSSQFQLYGFVDSDWARCSETRKSITSFCVMMGDSTICWKSKKQQTVSRSSTEVEYRALASLTFELQWLQYLFADLQVQFSKPASVFYDSKSAIHLAHNPTFHERNKHIELDCHVIREKL
ncbi:uncharacterized mitochondrial protein AtMg00810-like [Vicia villosa]|uniref:uncharacterized mitochondrial protein AtMg00810-like n=1 Tax=Vicia villosa TaxID=3911 RepID=UPI00273BA347|nr:uncharacterized mitochondrial protein AtMg00810-like [Vicia villosa]